VSFSESATVTETSLSEALQTHAHPVGLPYSSDQPVAQAGTYTTQNETQEKNIRAISGILTRDFRYQGVATYAFDCMTAGIGRDVFI
jgi:hypothetical protein